MLLLYERTHRSLPSMGGFQENIYHPSISLKNSLDLQQYSRLHYLFLCERCNLWHTCYEYVLYKSPNSS